MNHACHLVIALAGLALALPAAGQSSTTGADRPTDGAVPRQSEWNQHDATDRARTRTFTSFDEITGMAVMCASDGQELKKAGKITNVVLDRYTGRVVALVVDLGMFSKNVSLPLNAVAWSADEDGDTLLRTSYTEAQLEAFSPFSADRPWDVAPEVRDAYPDRAIADPFERRTDAQHQTVSGAIERVESIDMPGGETFTFVVIRDEANTMHHVALGPTWYDRSSNSLPFRGDTVTVKGYPSKRGDVAIMVASELTLPNGRTTVYREATGDSDRRWDLAASDEPDARLTRYILGSSLDGRSVEARGESCGNVSDVVFDRTGNGAVAFLTIDPDDNFLGIGDTTRLVPYSLAMVPAEGSVRIDATKEMIVAGREAPNTMSELNSAEALSAAYRPFGVEPYWGATDGAAEPRTGDVNGSAWIRASDAMRSAPAESHNRFSGVVKSIDRRHMGDELGHATVLRVSDNDNREHVVVLGPEPIAGTHASALRAGEKVNLTVTRITLNGQDYWVAESFTHGSGQAVSLWDDRGYPVWRSR